MLCWQLRKTKSTEVLLTWKKIRGHEPGLGGKEPLLTGLAMYSGPSAKDSEKQVKHFKQNKIRFQSFKRLL